ncbi:hypothetical protein B0H17DRAFT_1274932 [Mycena rosella]|uniref:Uncharacterized protein n=1 Tax=Mycena rosella TaxID=1033263 RepID=A0AAD7GLG4_MYCRO|nr:hypothetical protein B0H17DRAFT_1274932 [Mycena rosella]
MCTDAYWQGYCVDIPNARSGECVNLGGDLNHLVSSFGPDPGQACSLFACVLRFVIILTYNAHCSGFNCDHLSGEVGPVRAPGVEDMSLSVFNTGEGGGRPFNDALSSYRCAPPSLCDAFALTHHSLSLAAFTIENVARR